MCNLMSLGAADPRLDIFCTQYKENFPRVSFKGILMSFHPEGDIKGQVLDHQKTRKALLEVV